MIVPYEPLVVYPVLAYHRLLIMHPLILVVVFPAIPSFRSTLDPAPLFRPRSRRVSSMIRCSLLSLPVFSASSMVVRLPLTRC